MSQKETSITNNKIIKDTSEIYKSCVDNVIVIDRVCDNNSIKNKDGYDELKTKIRSDRQPIFGGMFCASSESE